MRKVSELSGKTAQHIIDLICEANRRKYYDRQLFQMIMILLASEFKKETVGKNSRLYVSRTNDTGGIATVFLISRKIDLRNCISENDMKKLKQIKCVIDTNILSMKLLQMFMTKNDNPHQLIEEILTINMPHKATFTELENMLRYCMVDNKEKIWVVVYQRLEDEDFDGCDRIRNRIMNDMIEARCNAATR